MLDSDVKVLRQVEDAKYDADQQRIPIIRIEFMVGKFGPFVERLDKESFTKEKRDDTLNRFAQHIRA
jgi:hypothetical protein